jgi:hypothetical protein
VFSAEEGSRLFAYKRGKLLLAVNPGQQALTLTADGDYDLLFAYGNVEVQGEAVQLSAQSFAVLQPKV